MTAFAARAALLLSSAALGSARHATVGKTFLAGSTDPTSGSTPWALTSHGIAEKLFTVDEGGNIMGQIADSIMKVNMSWEVQLKANYMFSDGTAVTAENVAAALTKQNQENDNAKASVGSMTFTAMDGLKLRIESERPTPVMDAVLAEWAFVVFLQRDGHFFYTGPYAVHLLRPNEKIMLVPNMYYSQADQRPEVTIMQFPDGDSLATALGNGELDLAFHLPVDPLPGLRQQEGISVKSFPVGYHYMMHYNTQKPTLSDVRVRRAIDLALDRSALSQELRGGRATVSLFPETSPYYLQEAAPYPDTVEAERLLDEAGWAKNGNGIREKDGVLLALDLVAYPQRPGLPTMQPLIDQSLTALGIQVNSIVTSGESWDQLDAIMAARSWDLLMWAQHTLPAGDPQWFLNAFFRSDGNRNYAGLNNSDIDGLLDALAVAEATEDRMAAAAAAHSAVLAEVPISNLVTPEWHVGLSERLSSYTPWGSDYYVIRADFGLGCCDETTTTEKMEVDGARQSILSALPALALFLSTVF